MGFLAPFYLAGLLAIGIPIVLHLIKRTPQGRQMFSSLMFLTPSPPRITKRSRLSNILLLILRALAFTVLALAFARPFFNLGSNKQTEISSGRRIIFLVDASASMKRPDLWTEANRQVEVGLADVKPADEVGLYYFDKQVRPALSMAEWNQAELSTRLALFRSRLATLSPGWSATRLGDALAAAADLASENNSTKPGEGKISRQVILISDFQEGGKVQTLMGHEWPKEVSVRTLPVAAKQAGNASVQWVTSTTEQPGAVSLDGFLRVNLTNQADSTREQFTLTWASAKGAMPGEPIQVYVPPGRSQVVKVPLPPEPAAAGALPADRLVLAGDDADFDNVLYIVPPHAEALRVVYIGDDPATDVNAIRYYLQSALFDTAQRKVEFVGRAPGEALTDGDLANTRLVVVGSAPSDATVARLKSYVEAGGDLLWVGKDLEVMQKAGGLLGRDLQVGEAGGDYALISRVETTHPLFAPFADPRFADFTKIHFWKHRQVKWSDGSGLSVLAAFDNGDPFLFEQVVGKGVIRVMTSGWQPGDSQLALSSKFLPLLEEMVKRKDAIAILGQYSVDDAIGVPVAQRGGEVTGPDEKVMKLGNAATFSGDKPGVYVLEGGGKKVAFAVNLASEESQTVPVPAVDLEQWGVKFTSPEAAREIAARERELLNTELENRQKSWRWLLLGVLGLLAVETALAGRLSGGAISERAAV